MANRINKRIFEMGTIVKATKLPVITIGLGKVKNLTNLKNVIWEENGNKIVVTKEAPDGCLYDQDRDLVVRVIGGTVLMDGMYDLYAPAPNKIEKLLGNPIVLEDYLMAEHLDQLQPILDVASVVRPSLAPAEPGRNVIIITDEMLNGEDYIQCHCPWDPEDTLTKLYAGDIFLVEDAETYTGYRIGKDEFYGTHSLT